MGILCFVRNLVEIITKKDCSRCKHCLEGALCDNYQRYCDCVSGFYPKGFEPRDGIKEDF